MGSQITFRVGLVARGLNHVTKVLEFQPPPITSGEERVTRD